MKIKALLAMLGFGMVTSLSPGRAIMENYHSQAAQTTAPWSRAAVTCVPDDGTSARKYNALTLGGKLSFEGPMTGSIFFWCDVTSPLDTAGENPVGWNAIYATFKAPGSSFVDVRLYRQRKSSGATAMNARFARSSKETVRQEQECFSRGFDFNTYAYFVRIELHRDNTTEDPQIYNVTLAECFG